MSKVLRRIPCKLENFVYSDYEPSKQRDAQPVQADKRVDDDDDDDERMNFNVAEVLRLQGHVKRRNNSEVTW